MRRVSRYMSGILICLGLTASIVCATFWRRTLRSMDSIQFITAAGTAYSMDTEPHSVSVVLQTHYLEYIRANNLDWFEPSTPGWSFKAIQYQVDYERPERPTIPWLKS